MRQSRLDAQFEKSRKLPHVAVQIGKLNCRRFFPSFYDAMLPDSRRFRLPKKKSDR